MKSCILFISVIFLALLAFTAQSSASDKTPGTHDECQKDSECVSMIELKQACRHADPNADEPCPVVNRKYAPEIGSVDCYRNVGCKPVTKISCELGRCVGK